MGILIGKIPIEMCQFTRIPMICFKCRMLQNVFVSEDVFEQIF